MRPDDVFLTSYPRSGNTLTRYLLSAYLEPDHTRTPRTVSDSIPDIYVASGRRLERMPSPRILKSHEYSDPRYRRMVYIVRDPRAVAVSYFHHRRHFYEPEVRLATFVRRFVAGELDRFGRWDDHVDGWLDLRQGDPGWLLVRYEDLVDDPRKELVRILEFLDLEARGQRIDRALAGASLDHMRRVEKIEAQRIRRSRPGALTHVRRGSPVSWRDELDEESRSVIEDAFSSTMSRIRYDLSGSDRSGGD